MIAHKKRFGAGLAMMIGFVVVLVLIFLPIYGGQNGLNYLDALYNSISKGSAYYIPAVGEEIRAAEAGPVSVALTMADENRARQTALLFDRVGRDVRTEVNGSQLKVEGNLGEILLSCLADADLMYHNKGDKLREIYHYDERQVLYNWHQSLIGMEKDLKQQKQFKLAKLVSLIDQKAVECAYNYYTIEPKKISDAFGVVVFSLLFYVLYTLWYGFAVMYLFEGWGLRLEH